MPVGDGAWWPGRWIAIPPAEASNDPGGPREAMLGMWVFLEHGFAFDAGVERIEHSDLVVCEADGGGFDTMPIAGLVELEDDGSTLGGDCGKFDEALSGGKLTVFEPEALQFQKPPKLLDIPALFVPIDNTPSRRDVRDVMGCKEPPVQRLD